LFRELKSALLADEAVTWVGFVLVRDGDADGEQGAWACCGGLVGSVGECDDAFELVDDLACDGESDSCGAFG